MCTNMGGSGGATARHKIETGIEQIRNAAREQLLVFDKNGDITYREGGVKNHVGYGLYSDEAPDYKDKIVAHNHPKGTAPYPSDTDFDTFQKHDAAEMIVVSRDYTVLVRKDPDFKSISGIRGSISQTAYRMGKTLTTEKIRTEWREGKYNTKTMNEKMRDTLFELYKKAAKRSGYIMTVKKRT